MKRALSVTAGILAVTIVIGIYGYERQQPKGREFSFTPGAISFGAGLERSSELFGKRTLHHDYLVRLPLDDVRTRLTAEVPGLKWSPTGDPSLQQHCETGELSIWLKKGSPGAYREYEPAWPKSLPYPTGDWCIVSISEAAGKELLPRFWR